MSPVLGAGKVINVTCKEARLPEFPVLMFGTHIDGSLLFDATNYLSSQYPKSLSVQGFFKAFEHSINSIATTLQISESQLVYINQDGHHLLDSCLLWPFIAYCDPKFCVYIADMLDELFSNGFVVSDSNLVRLCLRLPADVLKKIADE